MKKHEGTPEAKGCARRRPPPMVGCPVSSERTTTSRFRDTGPNEAEIS